MFMKLLLKWIICFGALLIVSAIFPYRFVVYGGMMTLAAAATVLWLINLALRPILQILALPITIVTLGLFSLVVNAALVSLTDILIPAIQIRGFGTALFIALIIAVGNGLFAVGRKS
jgi:putative membrane protein